MGKIILKIFDLQDLGDLFKRVTVVDKEIVLEFGDRREAICPLCGQWSRRRHARGKLRKVYHGYCFGRKVYLVFRQWRYFCKPCGKAFLERLSLVSPRQRRTVRAEEQILESLRGRSLRSLEEKEGISYGVSRRVLERRLDPEKLVWEEERAGELALGIDAHSFRGTRLVQTVTELSGRRPLTILPDHQKATILRFLREIPSSQKERIREVCIDMDQTLLSAVEEELPEAQVVVDHFHLIQDANRRVDEARKIEQDAWKVEIPRKLFLVAKEKLSPKEKAKVEFWCQKYPSLKEFYWMKEALRSFYQLKRKTVAEKKTKRSDRDGSAF